MTMKGPGSGSSRRIAASLVWLFAVAASTQAQDLFRIQSGPLGAEALAGGVEVAGSSAIVEARLVEIDGAQLASGQETVHFSLFSGAGYEAVLSGLERRSASDITWRGWLGEPGRDRVVFTYRGDAVAGMIFSPEGVYEIAPLPGGRQRLAKLDQDRFPLCGGSLAPPKKATWAGTQALTGAADPSNQIDVMVAYTPQARDAAGGVSAIQATAQSAVDMANTSFIDSGMVARFVLVGTLLASRNDSGDMVADLYWLAADNGIAAARDVVRADLVSLLVASGQFCGVGFVMQTPSPLFAGDAFQVTALGCAVGNLSYAHEHGHNMGMEHNPENGNPPALASYPWSYGHYVDGSFRTVMSYVDPCPHGCNRVARFSNPNLTYAGQPTGIGDQRDNHRTGDLTAPIVANFRQRTLGRFYTLTPCRLLDTRQPGQGPALTSGLARTITTVGKCGVPSSAAALVANVTVVLPTSSGHLTLEPGNPAPASTSTLNFQGGQVRANNAVLPLAADGLGTSTLQPFLLDGGTVHVIVDVSGYFD
jgi:hypothetical protein